MVGGTLGQKRTVLPLLASQTFHRDLYTSALTYILAFGLSKAAMNYFAERFLTGTAANPSSSQAGW
jgi:hypothetical protein